jgi:hypothetical protein
MSPPSALTRVCLEHVTWLAFGCDVIALGGCGAVNGVDSAARPALPAAVQTAQMPKPFDLRSMHAIRATLPIPASALTLFRT